MSHLPISYYRIGQRIQVDDVSLCQATIAEISGKHISFFFGQERNSIRYLRSVGPEFVKPILRPLSQIRISHVIGLFRVMAPGSTFSDDDIIDYANLNPGLIEVWADSTKPCLWLLEQGYDVQELIKQNLAVADEA